MWEMIAGSAIGAGLSYFEERDRVRREREALEKQRRAFTDAKYDASEQAKMNSTLDRSYNTNSLNQMNSSALGLNGILNSDTLRGLQSSRLLGERASARMNLEGNILAHNNQMDMQIAGLSGTIPSMNTGNIMMGGLAGLQIGESIGKLNTTKVDDVETKAENNKNIREFSTTNKKTYPLLGENNVLNFKKPLNGISGGIFSNELFGEILANNFKKQSFSFLPKLWE